MTIAIVTGSSTGIGLAVALGLARAGHTVYGTMRNPKRAPALAQTAKEEGLPVHVIAMDVDSDVSVSSGIAKIIEEAGTVDILINNAGIAPLGSIEEMPLSGFREVMETNYFGLLRCTQAVLPTMRRQKSGVVVNISSVAGRNAVSPNGAYSGSKFAVEGLSEILCQEMWSFGGRVAVIEPGLVKTAILGKMLGDEEEVQSHYPSVARLRAYYKAGEADAAEPEEVWHAIQKFLDSDDGTLRHPVGKDVVGVLPMRHQMSDEDWNNVCTIQDDDEWRAMMKATYDLDIAL